MGIIIAHHQ